MNQVLAAIDTSPCAPAVLETARSVAELFQAGVIALHVREDGVEAALEVARHADVTFREAQGSPIEAIAAAAADPDVVVVVLGARGVHSGPRPAGRTALEVVMRVSKPVVVVPPDGTAGAPITRVLTPLEGSGESSQAIADTIALARRRDVEIVVLHVHGRDEIPAFQDQPQHAIPAWEREFAARFVVDGHTRVEVIERVGSAADHIAPAASDVDADLIALGWNQELAPGRAEVVRAALARSAVPVLLVPYASGR